MQAAAEPQNNSLPEYLTPEVLEQIDAKRFLSSDVAYQFEIGAIIGIDHISDLAEYLKQHH